MPPLTRQRIERLLNALDAMGGDFMEFLRMGNAARFARSRDGGVRAGIDRGAVPPDMAEMADDLLRLQSMYMMGGGAAGGRMDAGALGALQEMADAWDEEDDVSDLDEETRQVHARLSAVAAARNPHNPFAVTPEEREAIQAYAPRIAEALDPRRSATVSEMDAAWEAERASLLRIGDDDPDARTWVRENPLDNPLGPNRFGDAADALAFIDGLYAAGAVRVVIAGETIEDDEEFDTGAQSADAVKVQLPAEPGKRQALFGIAGREARAQALTPERDQGQDLLVIWWD